MSNFVLVYGGFVGGWHWGDVPQRLEKAGHTAPDRWHPTTYIICEHDQALPPAAQEQMAAAADHVERLASSHQPMRSMPDQLAAVLGRVH